MHRRKKKEIYQRGPDLEVGFKYTNFFWPPPPPPGVVTTSHSSKAWMGHIHQKVLMGLHGKATKAQPFSMCWAKSTITWCPMHLVLVPYLVLDVQRKRAGGG